MSGWQETCNFGLETLFGRVAKDCRLADGVGRGCAFRRETPIDRLVMLAAAHIEIRNECYDTDTQPLRNMAPLLEGRLTGDTNIYGPDNARSVCAARDLTEVCSLTVGEQAFVPRQSACALMRHRYAELRSLKPSIGFLNECERADSGCAVVPVCMGVLHIPFKTRSGLPLSLGFTPNVAVNPSCAQPSRFATGRRISHFCEFASVQNRASGRSAQLPTAC